MTSSGGQRTVVDDESVTIERVMEAPRSVVWQAWTDCEHFSRWYGPEGFTLPHCEIDFRVGGRHLWGMRSPDGWEMWTTGVYQEIEELERFTTTEVSSDTEGNPAPGPGMEGPMETLLSVRLEDLDGGRTRMTVRQSGWASSEMGEGAGGGWSQAFEKLAATLEEVA